MALIFALNIFEFFVNRPALLRLRRVANIDNCSNNQIFFDDQLYFSRWSRRRSFVTALRTLIACLILPVRNLPAIKVSSIFALPKNSNLLPHQAILMPIGDPFIELTTVDS